jgi:hypothetical protein
MKYKARAWYCLILSFFAFFAPIIADDTPNGYLLVRASIVALVLIFWCMNCWTPPRE